MKTKRFHLSAIPLALVMAAALGCSDTELASSSPAIEVEWDQAYGYPDVLNFGTVTIGTYDEADVFITNTGNGNLDIRDISLFEESTELTEDGNPILLEPQAAAVVHVRFTPMLNAEGGNILIIENGATADPVEVPIVTMADGDPVPDIYADPPEHDFGQVENHQTATMQFTIGNAGFNTLEVYGAALTGADADHFEILDDQVSGLNFDPNSPPSVITISFSPDEIASYVAYLEIDSNDPDESPLSIPLTAEGTSPAGDGPVAICAVNPQLVHPPFEFATWQGHDSYDTGGFDIVTYDWSLASVPAGSSAQMPQCNNTSDCGPFSPDLGGTYTGQLYIENELGQTDTCTVDLEAVPLEDFWVEMYWSHAQDDMDLHVLAPGGSPRSNTDCYYANCTGSGLNWGDPAYSGDDPVLDLDDIPGTGPENINIYDPATGTYTIFVDDYSGSTSDFQGGNDVTVNVYINGGLVFTDTRVMNGEGPDMYFCQVEWPSGSVTPM